MAPLEPSDPQEIGGYRLLGRLGAGGMGLVFLGRSPAGLTVAVKVIHEHFAQDPKFRARFRREVTTARAVSGAFTAPVIDADPEAASPWLVTTFLAGKPLNEAVAEHGPLPSHAVARLGAGLAEALISIHRAGVVHRDLKPHNVMISPDGPRVIDFGIAHAADLSAITRAGTVVGSPGYMSPEQARGHETGPAGDVFSLGAVLAFAATGAGPFGRAQMQVMVYRVVHEQPQLEGVADPRLRALIAACLSKDPARRPTPAQLLQALGTAAPHGVEWLPAGMAESIAESATQVPFPRKRIGRRTFILGATGAAAVGTVGALATAEAAGIRTPFTLGGRAPVIPEAKPVRKLQTGAPISASPVLYRDKVIIGNDAGVLVAFDDAKGHQLWRTSLTGRFRTAFAKSDHMLYAVGDDGVLHAVDMRDGKEKWRKGGCAPDAAPAASNAVVLVLTGSSSNRPKAVVAYHHLTGAPQGQPFANATSPPVAGTDYQTREVIYLCQSGSMNMLDPRSLKRKEQFPDQGGGSFVMSDSGIMYGVSARGELWAYGTKNNSVVWPSRRPGGSDSSEPAVGTPAVNSGAVCVGDKGGVLHVIENGKWAVRSTFTTDGAISSSPRLSGDTVYIGSADSSLYSIDSRFGKAHWRCRTGGPIDRSTPEVSSLTGLVYVGSGDGSLYAVKVQ